MNSRARKNFKVSQQQSLSNDLSFKKYELNFILKNFMIKEAFQMFDSDGSGEIDPKEFKKLVMSLGIEVDDKKIYALYKEIDTNRSGTIDLQEFTAMMIKYEFNRDSPVEQHLENTFNLYDKNGDGIIDRDDLKKVGDEFDYYLPNEDIDILLKIIKIMADESKITHGQDLEKVSKEEFVNVLMKFNFLTEVKKEDLESKEHNLNSIDKLMHIKTGSNIMEKKTSSRLLGSRENSKRSFKSYRSESKSPSKSLKSAINK